MAVVTGTSTDWKDLLNDLQVAAAANGWVVIDYDTQVGDELPDTLYLEGPGVTLDENVYVQIQTHADVDSLNYAWRIRASVAHSTGLEFEGQPGVSPEVFMNLDDDTINYTFYISNRRIVVIARIATFVMSAYMGFFLPFATPIEYPYPLLVSASSATIHRYTTVQDADRAMSGPGNGAAFLRTTDGQWQGVWNWANNNSIFDNHYTEGGFYCWPQYSGQGATDANAYGNMDVRPPELLPDAHTILPVHLFGARENIGVVGVFEDVYFGHNATLNTGDTIDIGAETYTVYQSINRAGNNQFFYVREA